ncbi:hypothetical protein DJ568_01270 [Mucilaginibacter hurinus]|uniref:TonB-dependent receptor plug domain-containing protein n=1 Tax=Mucilaginibacter hurinus TaxID=2201324 RepID=A0A367GSX3_9SPHI|nr:hypothetical protein [Mucilaginibacter hurinus]RCH56517.1 hypothetical protein DJ568_01270 [Mucilaginibacter hurinus]
MRKVCMLFILLLPAVTLFAQPTRFKRDTTGGFQGVYCIGPLDLEAGPMIILDDNTITAAEFKKLNEKDIEKVNVYKDSLATALYGNSAIHGAIIITTKNKKKAKR